MRAGHTSCQFGRSGPPASLSSGVRRDSMSNRSLTILAFGIAIVSTILGFQQVWLYKSVPPQRIALWFPALLILRLPEEFSRLLLCLVQFPILAAAFSIGIRRWKITPTLCAVVLSYALIVAVAFAMIKPR